MPGLLGKKFPAPVGTLPTPPIAHPLSIYQVRQLTTYTAGPMAPFFFAGRCSLAVLFPCTVGYGYEEEEKLWGTIINTKGIDHGGRIMICWFIERWLELTGG